MTPPPNALDLEALIAKLKKRAKEWGRYGGLHVPQFFIQQELDTFADELEPIARSLAEARRKDDDAERVQRIETSLRWVQLGPDFDGATNEQLVQEIVRLRSLAEARGKAEADDDDGSLATHLRYARGLLRKAKSSGASFLDINVMTVRYLVDNRRNLNDRLRWAEERQAAAESRAKVYEQEQTADHDALTRAEAQVAQLRGSAVKLDQELAATQLMLSAARRERDEARAERDALSARLTACRDEEACLPFRLAALPEKRR